ncbi:MAG: 6-carboxytetrahydropterin synthase [Hyphomonadaceae bacterium]
MATKLTDPQTDRTSLDIQGRVFEISKSVNFEAAHRLPSGEKAGPYGRIHGHSFELEATLSGQVQPGKLWVEDIAVLTAALEEVAKELDHQLLNDIEGLAVPTLENILVWVSERLSVKVDHVSQVKLSRPSLKEVCVLRLSNV